MFNGVHFMHIQRDPLTKKKTRERFLHCRSQSKCFRNGKNDNDNVSQIFGRNGVFKFAARIFFASTEAKNFGLEESNSTTTASILPFRTRWCHWLKL